MKILKDLINYLLPKSCVLCGKILFDSGENILCDDCTAVLLPLNSNSDVQLCRCCGLPLISETGKCSGCRSEEKFFISNRSLFKYSSGIKELIYQYKFKGIKRISFFFAKMIADSLLNIPPGVVIVPVPGRKTVKREKGWEHIDLIGEILKHKYRLPVIKLLRRSGQKAQKSLTIDKRAINLRNTIKLRREIASMPESLILLDDVFTTGTTINECARVLKHAGVKEINSLTIAID